MTSDGLWSTRLLDSKIAFTPYAQGADARYRQDKFNLEEGSDRWSVYDLLTARQFLRHPTVSALAGLAEEAGIAIAEQGPLVGEAPLTPIQRWFVEQASL